MSGLVGSGLRRWTTVVLAFALASLAAAPIAAQENGADSGPSTEVGSTCAPGSALLVGVLTDEGDAARLAPLTDLVRQLAGLDRERVDLLVASARPDYQPLTQWERVTPGSADRLAGFVESGGPTEGDDPVGALSPAAGLAGLHADIEERAAELSDDHEAICRLVLVLSSAQVATADDDPLCAAAGPIEQLRGSSTTMWVTSPGVGQAAEGVTALLERMTLDPGCSDTAPVATSRYLASDDVGVLSTGAAELIGWLRGSLVVVDDLAVCDGEACADGAHELVLEPVLGRVGATILLPSDTAEVLVGLPRGAEFGVNTRSGGSIGAGSFTIRTIWVTPSVLRLEADVSPSQSDWVGPWTFTVIEPDGTDPDGTDPGVAAVGGAQLVVDLAPGLTAQPTGNLRFVEGRPVTFEVEVVDRDGRLIDVESIGASVAVTATLFDVSGDELVAAPLEPLEAGIWSGAVEVPAGEGVAGERAAATVEIALTGRLGLGELPDVVTAVDAEILDGSAWPEVGDTSVTLSGEPEGRATGAVTVSAGSAVDACIWLDQAAFETGEHGSNWRLGDDARSALSCSVVPAGETFELPLAVELDDLDPGTYTGSATLGIATAGSETFDLVDLDVRLEIVAPVDHTSRLLVAAAMSVAALILPLLALGLLDALKARFHPSKRAVAIDVWIAVWSDGSMYRVDTDGSPLILSDDLCEPADLPRGRRFEWRGLRFRVRNSLSPFRQPVATVGADDAPVVASGGAIVDSDTVVGRVRMNLANTWVFVLEPEATRAAASDPTAPDFYAAYGRLVVIRSSIDTGPVDLSGLERQAHRLARTVRSARPSDGGTTQDMLDFVEVNVSTPRDLPRMRSAEQGDEPGEALQRALPQGEDLYDFSDLDGLFATEDDDEGEGAVTAQVEARPTDGADPLDTRGDEELAEAGRWEQAEADGKTERAERADRADRAGRGESGNDDESTDPGFGIVFEERVNPAAFLEPDQVDQADATGPGKDDEASSDADSDSALGWARKKRPNWPTPRRDKES